ncbi:GNAT family N-acetyltransferase [Shouchella sp. 1P09AA]|uniref:GNAT family N-acetyltransferase n=1 Tax=unclassified Shouchella TaxID=2893065 RepID=UPI00399F8DB3
MEIRQLQKNEDVPYDLLLLADPNQALVDAYLNQGNCYVLEINKQIVGCYVLLKTRPQTIEIINIAVTKQMHGRGYGKALLAHAIEKSKEAGYQTIEIGTSNSSINQLAFYQKYGFRMDYIDRGFFLRHYDEEIWEDGIQALDMVRLSMHFS